MSETKIIVILSIIFTVLKIIDYIIRRKNDTQLIDMLTENKNLLNEIKTEIDVNGVSTREKHEQLLEITLSHNSKIESVLAKTDKCWNLHDRYDYSGMPLWYTPRVWLEYQEKSVNSQTALAEHMVSITNTLSLLMHIVQKIDERLDK